MLPNLPTSALSSTHRVVEENQLPKSSDIHTQWHTAHILTLTHTSTLIHTHILSQSFTFIHTQTLIHSHAFLLSHTLTLFTHTHTRVINELDFCSQLSSQHNCLPGSLAATVNHVLPVASISIPAAFAFLLYCRQLLSPLPGVVWPASLTAARIL